VIKEKKLHPWLSHDSRGVIFNREFAGPAK